MSDLIDPGRRARKSAKKAEEAQNVLIAEQKQKEKLKLAERIESTSSQQRLLGNL